MILWRDIYDSGWSPSTEGTSEVSRFDAAGGSRLDPP